MAVKLDMSKAFDRIEWGFLIATLRRLGFHNDWCDMIYECVSTISATIILNGRPGEVFYPTRGLRKGDPLSPYFFIICMESFSRLLVHAEVSGKIQGIRVTKHCPSISHLFFADDCLVFTRAIVNGVKHLVDIIHMFSKFSGQSINFDKSRLSFSPKTNPNVMNQIASILNIRRMALQDKYLGVPLLIQKNKVETFDHLSGRFGNRLALWNGKHLNMPGRTVLAQTVLVAQLKALVCLNLKKTEVINITLLTKLAWRLISEEDSLWGKVMKGVCKGISVIKENYCWEVSDGRRISIWKDVWILCWKTSHSSQFASSYFQSVDQLIDHDNKTWKLDILASMFNNATVKDILNIRIPSTGTDQLRRVSSENCIFSVKTAYRVLDSPNSNVFTNPRIEHFPWVKFWKTSLPPNIMHFIWKCVYGCLPVRETLVRYVAEINPRCPLCDREDEDMQHLLIDCDISKAWLAVNSNIAGICNGVNLIDWVTSWYTTNDRLAAANKELAEIASFTLSHIWKLRCAVVFDNAHVNISIIVSLINQSKHDRVTSNSNQLFGNQHGATMRLHIPWTRPPENFTKVNFDVSFPKDSKLMGTGLIIVDDAGNWRAVGCILAVA
ncbi:uncharacterized protein LOC113305688 [Papaver somniferum]|uniref:uncharacterized protein LOC113305688 n=1 Tax=Papaver somniferum TaxID=3469 RepID=UPI000E7007D3|nr:uncharacterized protein LOC113305688 [Papaver somniferum]